MGAPAIKVMLIDDDEEEFVVIRKLLPKAGRQHYQLEWVSNYQDAIDTMSQNKHDVYLVDYYLGQDNGLDLIVAAIRKGCKAPAILLTGQSSAELDSQAIKAGAADYLNKGKMDSELLDRSIRYAIERSQAQEALFTEKEHALITLASITDGVIRTDPSGLIEYLNPIAEKLTGWALPMARGLSIHAVFDISQDRVTTSKPEPFSERFAASPNFVVYKHAYLVNRDGGGAFIENAIEPVYSRQGVEIGKVLVFRDVTESHNLSTQLLFQATHDALTKLPNRALFYDELERAVVNYHRDHRAFAVMFLDLDGFKRINDTLGHDYGDELLKVVADRLTHCIRETDMAARLGGDEFTVILRYLNDEKDAAMVAQHILGRFSEPVMLGNNELFVTASVGIAVYPNDGASIEALLRNADTAMYQAKETHPNSFSFYTADMNAAAHKKLVLVNGLYRALERNEFLTYYQPQVDLLRGKIMGMEVLLRWQHPELGFVPPSEFIPIAEEIGLMTTLGEWMLLAACQQKKIWQQTNVPVEKIAVNLSVRQFDQQKLVEQVTRVLEASGLAPSCLELELTEGAIMKSPDAVVRTLRRLKDLGVHISIDDFGTGYSSLSYLKRFPIDALKIDQSFVKDLTTNQNDAEIVRTIITMANNLHLEVVAEGVETIEQQQFLLNNGCTKMQGYLFSPPVPANEGAKYAIQFHV